MKYIYNDGGRKIAGYKGGASDCVVRAIAIVTEIPYQKIYDDLFELNKKSRCRYNLRGKISPREGATTTITIRKYLTSLGWKWIPTMAIGSGCKVHLKNEELPKGRIITRLSKHLTAVIDGVINDTHDPSRDGTRCVYGYYIK
jgi:hypothetical protein